uniref:Putative ribonuclease t2 n=1 Tax=Ornithodoros turicata TaxID=34597 RepID=A0A2R5LB57_9ACAR
MSGRRPSLLLLSVLAIWIVQSSTQMPPKKPGANAQEPMYPDRPFDYLILSVMWPNGFCKTDIGKKCVQDKAKKFNTVWTVHGMWPYGNRGPPTYCNCSVKFEMAQITTLYSDLNKYWPSLIQLGAEAFWKHEWDKHGTCAFTCPLISGQRNYFSRTMEYFHKVSIIQKLENGGIRPRQAPYPVAQIQHALTVAWKFPGSISVVCSRSSDARIRYSLLHEIRFYFNKTLHPLNVGLGYVENGCSPNFLYLQ